MAKKSILKNNEIVVWWNNQEQSFERGTVIDIDAFHNTAKVKWNAYLNGYGAAIANSYSTSSVPIEKLYTSFLTLRQNLCQSGSKNLISYCRPSQDLAI